MNAGFHYMVDGDTPLDEFANSTLKKVFPLNLSTDGMLTVENLQII